MKINKKQFTIRKVIDIITLMARIYEQVRKAIRASIKSRYAISKEIGISQSHLSQFMDGTKGLSVDALECLTDCLGLEITIRPKRRQKGC